MSAQQPLDIQQSIQLALQYHHSGKLQLAEQMYQEILTIEPGNVDANHFLGVIAHQLGHSDRAIELIQRAIRSNPDVAEPYNSLGEAWRSKNRLDEAISSYRKAISVRPGFAEVHYNLATTLKELDRMDEAVASFKMALSIKPDYAKAHNNLGVTLKDLDQLDDAITSYRKAVAIQPNYAEAHYNLGIALHDLGQLDGAVISFNRALAIKPNYAEVYVNLGNTFRELGQLGDAATNYRVALSLEADYAQAHYNLGTVLRELGFLREAVCCYESALNCEPANEETHNNLGVTLQDLSLLDEAIACYRKALAFDPDYRGIHSNLLFALNYHANLSREDIYTEHRRWHDRHAKQLLPPAPTHRNNRDGERKLRIGYISADFRSHSVASFIEPLLRQHDTARVEIYCYSNVIKPDAVTQRLKDNSSHWCSIVGKTDQTAADQIRHDEIDILVDLAGHTENNRLLVLARKPAPVQVTWLGYPNTTGLQAIDYRFTDEITDPVGLSDEFHSEELIRLENGFLSFQGIESASVNATLPCSERGYITFGSFNNLTKAVSEVVCLWTEILRRVPDAHLLLKSKQLADKEVQERYLTMFSEGQISNDRIEFHIHQPNVQDHLQLYSKVDIGLDPFPYNGTTTTCEALWMGVPVITLSGDRHAARVGASLLTQVGLPDLIAEDPKSYIDLAVGLAEDTDKLARLRRSLRSMMMQSELCNAAKFARKVEDAYAVMWKKYLSETHLNATH